VCIGAAPAARGRQQRAGRGRERAHSGRHGGAAAVERDVPAVRVVGDGVGGQAPAGVGRARQDGRGDAAAAEERIRGTRRVQGRPRAAGAGPAVPARRGLRLLRHLRQGQAAAGGPRQGPAPLTIELGDDDGKVGRRARALVMMLHAMLYLIL